MNHFIKGRGRSEDRRAVGRDAGIQGTESEMGSRTGPDARRERCRGGPKRAPGGAAFYLSLPKVMVDSPVYLW